MRQISAQAITQLVAQLCIQANTNLPQDLERAIARSRQRETSPLGQSILGDILENCAFAREKGLPICQDTGMALVFLTLGQEVHIIDGDLEAAVAQGVAQGYSQGFLRCSVVGDPLRRVNTEDNTPPILHLRMVPGNQVTITVAPKGFGSENMTSLRMFNPSATQGDIEDYIVSCVKNAGSNPCPPVVVGVGLGGTAEVALRLAKEALLRSVESENADPYYGEMEGRVLAAINALGIGPQGLGGDTTALGVAIMPHPTHIAGLPCAVCLGCHVTRHAQGVL